MDSDYLFGNLPSAVVEPLQLDQNVKQTSRGHFVVPSEIAANHYRSTKPAPEPLAIARALGRRVVEIAARVRG